MQKICKIHGLTDFTFTHNTNGRCKKCKVVAVQKRRRELKELAIVYKGGKCEKCGYSKCNAALQFHHIDSSLKEFGLSSRGVTRKWSKVKEELDKCILLCANCHAEEHYQF